jgi:hypothetical protein
MTAMASVLLAIQRVGKIRFSLHQELNFQRKGRVARQAVLGRRPWVYPISVRNRLLIIHARNRREREG